MKFKLSLLLLLSLMWQAVASADEWTNIATAVTVTEGRFCVGEAALDGTGTDVKCDDSNPYIDDDGNIGIGTANPANSLTVVGDISATTINATQLCDEDGANCTDLSGGLSGVSSLASLTDVSVSAPVSGSYLTWNGSEWESTELVISSCPEGYAFLAGSCYKNSDLADTYANARNTCLADGADLAVINDSSEDTLVRDYSNASRFWIGYSDISVEGTFEWVDGSSAGYSNWHSGEPSNGGGNEDCTEVVLVNGGTWNDSQCSNNKYFICEKNPSQSNVGVTRLVSLTDVSASSPSTGEALIWNGSEWAPDTAGTTINSINDIDDVIASDAVAGSILRYDGTSWTAVADLSSALSTTMIDIGWPDAILCDVSNGERFVFPHTLRRPNSLSNRHLYSAGGAWVEFNSDMTFNSSDRTFTNCHASTPIATLYADGQAFNFLGNNGAQTSMTEIADVSASAPTDGQLLSYDASENEWVATDVISKTIIFNSIDDDPCVVTGGVHKLSFNPTTGRLRVCRP